MNSKWIKAAAVALCVGVAAYWYGSPFLAIHQMREAARAGDADSFNTHVDYPKLRENLKTQLSASFAPRAEDPNRPSSDWAKGAAAFGQMLGVAMVDRMVDALVRPQVVMRAMQEGQLMPKRSSSSRPTDTEGSQPDPAPESDNKKTDWWTERPNMDTFVLHARRADKPEDRQAALVFERRGFASWQLTDIRLSRTE